MKIFFKLIMVAILAVILQYRNAYSQRFYREYKANIAKGEVPKTKGSRRRNKDGQMIDHIRTIFRKVKEQTHVDMLSKDSLFMFMYFDPYQTEYSLLIWNQSHACFYSVKPSGSPDKKSPDMTIEINADDRLRTLSKPLKMLIQAADTNAFTNFVQSNPFGENVGTQFIVAVRKSRHWEFIHSKAYISTSSQ